MIKVIFCNIKSVQNIVFFCSVLGLLSSCSTVNYGIANQGSQARYMAKPIYKDTTSTGFYLSGQYYNNNQRGYDAIDEFSHYADFMIHRSHSLKKWNYSYGILGYTGSYDVRSIYNLKGKKNFTGAGILAEVNYKISFEKIEFRPVGLKAGLLYETGNYAEFRERADQLDYINDVNPENTPFFFGITSEVIYKKADYQVGLQLNFSYLSRINQERLGTIKTYQTLHFNYKNFTLLGTFSFISSRNHIFSTGLQYKF